MESKGTDNNTLLSLVEEIKQVGLVSVEETAQEQADRYEKAAQENKLYWVDIREKVTKVIEILKGNSFKDVQNILEGVGAEVEDLVRKAII